MPPAPNPQALRRVGRPIFVRVPIAEHEAAQADAASRSMSLAAHVRALLRQWRKEHRR